MTLWISQLRIECRSVLRSACLLDVIVGSPHFADSDTHRRGESVLHQPLHLIGHCCREEQRLPVWTDLPYDGPHLQGSNSLASHSGLGVAKAKARLCSSGQTLQFRQQQLSSSGSFELHESADLA